MLCHHAASIFVLLAAAIPKTFLPYAALALVMEINRLVRELAQMLLMTLVVKLYFLYDVLFLASLELSKLIRMCGCGVKKPQIRHGRMLRSMKHFVTEERPLLELAQTSK